MERFVFLLPFGVVPVVFATIAVPGSKTWGWLGRALLCSYIIMLVCGHRAISGFGSGAKGQDAAFIVILVLGSVAVAFATAMCGVNILADKRPAFAAWFRRRKILGSILTLAAALPLGFGLGVMMTLGGGFLLGLYFEILKR